MKNIKKYPEMGTWLGFWISTGYSKFYWFPSIEKDSCWIFIRMGSYILWYEFGKIHKIVRKKT